MIKMRRFFLSVGVSAHISYVAHTDSTSVGIIAVAYGFLLHSKDSFNFS